MQQPVVVTSGKINTSPQVLKVTQGGQSKRPVGKGKGVKPLDKGKKNAVKMTMSGVVTSAGPSANLQSKNKDKAKVTAALIQELTEELQAIEQNFPNDEPDSEVTQESDLEQEDSENYLTEDEEQWLTKSQDLFSSFLANDELDHYHEDIQVTIGQSEGSNECNMDHTEEVILGSEQGATFPTKIGATICNALIDAGATRCCIIEKYYRKL